MQDLKYQNNNLRQKLKELSIFYEIEKSVNSSSSLDLILEKNNQRALVLTNTKRGAIPLFDRTINKVNMVKHISAQYDTADLPIPPIGKGIFGERLK